MQKRFPMSRKLLLLIGDLLLLVFSTYLSLKVVLDQDILRINSEMYYSMVPVMVITMGILFNIYGLFSMERKKFADILLSLAVAMFSLMVIIMAFSFVTREFAYSRGVLVSIIAIQFCLAAIWRYSWWRFERLNNEAKQALLIGSEEECIRVYNRLKLIPKFSMNLKYVCDDLEKKLWEKVIDEIDVVIVCSDLSLRDKSDIVHYCNTNQKQVLLIPDIYELFCSGVELDKIDDIPVFRPKSLVPTLEQRSLKRILDFSVAGIAFCGCLPILIITALLIKIFDPGPILYSQIRTGRNEKEFKVYKFRTMRVDAEKLSGPVLATEHDPRITKLGAFMRATRLDELPQIWNVLVGDMSLVGPRPERPFFVEQFKKDIPEYVYRHNVKPGITGLAQVYGKYNTTPYDKLVYDLMYIQNCNILQDLAIMVQTVRVLVTKSSTEGVGTNAKSVNLDAYRIDNLYGDF